ncbi:hypothetical protein OROMI_029573 [Orobanche minor]
MCSRTTPNSDLTGHLKSTKLTIWDEAPMTNKFCFEALDHSLRNIMRGHHGIELYKSFGGFVVIFCGDFRQILHVMPNGSRQDIVHAFLCSSKRLWSSCRVLKLTKNMHLQTKCIRKFVECLLKVGDGKIGVATYSEVEFRLPYDMIRFTDEPVAAIVKRTYPGILDHVGDGRYFQDRAILALTNEIFQEIKIYIMSLLPGDTTDFKSSYSICRDEDDIVNKEDVYYVEFLNTTRTSRIPNHII